MPFTKNQNGELVYVESASPINAQLENIRGRLKKIRTLYRR
jgi:hypothetical protein